MLDQFPPESRTTSHRNHWTNCAGIRILNLPRLAVWQGNRCLCPAGRSRWSLKTSCFPWVQFINPQPSQGRSRFAVRLSRSLDCCSFTRMVKQSDLFEIEELCVMTQDRCR